MDEHRSIIVVRRDEQRYWNGIEVDIMHIEISKWHLRVSIIIIIHIYDLSHSCKRHKKVSKSDICNNTVKLIIVMVIMHCYSLSYLLFWDNWVFIHIDNVSYIDIINVSKWRWIYNRYGMGVHIQSLEIAHVYIRHYQRRGRQRINVNVISSQYVNAILYWNGR